MLAQLHEDRVCPIMFGGRVLGDTERKYATVDRELLACFYTLKKCEVYVVVYDYVIYTDHKPLISLGGFKDVVNRRFRWIQYLESMGAKLCYIEGKSNVVADFISRNIKETKKLDIISTCLLELSAVSYDVDDLIASQMNDPTLRQVKQCLQDQNYDTFPEQFSRYRQKLIISENSFQYKHHDKLLYVVPFSTSTIYVRKF